MVRAESSFGAVSALGATYTLLATVPSATTWNLHLHIANRLASTVKLRAYIADTTWASGEPTGSTLVAAIAYDLAIDANEVLQITGIVLTATDELVVYADTASSLDIIASGVAIT
jgi:hypothetical protein